MSDDTKILIIAGIITVGMILVLGQAQKGKERRAADKRAADRVARQATSPPPARPTPPAEAPSPRLPRIALASDAPSWLSTPVIRTPQKARLLARYHADLKAAFGQRRARQIAQIREDLCAEMQHLDAAHAAWDYKGPNPTDDITRASTDFIVKSHRRLTALGLTEAEQMKVRSGDLADLWRAACPGNGTLAQVRAESKALESDPRFQKLKEEAAAMRRKDGHVR